MDKNTDPINPEVMDEAPKSDPKNTTKLLSNEEVTMRAIVIWFIPVIGSLFYWNDSDSYIARQAKQALYSHAVMLLITFIATVSVIFSILSCFVPFLWLGLGVWATLKMQKREEVIIPIISDFVK